MTPEHQDILGAWVGVGLIIILTPWILAGLVRYLIFVSSIVGIF